MSFNRKHLLLYAVTDSGKDADRPLPKRVESALKGGATCIQLREKELRGEALIKEAEEIRALCAAYRVPLIINDDVDLAIRLDADGVHVGQQDMEAKEARRRLGPEKSSAFLQERWNRRYRPGRTGRTILAWERFFIPVPRQMQGRSSMKRCAGSAAPFPFRP